VTSIFGVSLRLGIRIISKLFFKKCEHVNTYAMLAIGSNDGFLCTYGIREE
jgi:hypothetical protein